METGLNTVLEKSFIFGLFSLVCAFGGEVGNGEFTKNDSREKLFLFFSNIFAEFRELFVNSPFIMSK